MIQKFFETARSGVTRPPRNTNCEQVHDRGVSGDTAGFRDAQELASILQGRGANGRWVHETPSAASCPASCRKNAPTFFAAAGYDAE